MAFRRSATWRRGPLPRWLELTLLLLILAVASGFRLYQIGQAPPGPHYDEAAAALDAQDVLAGHHMVYSPRSYGRETLFVYVAAPLVAVLGPTRLAIRLPTAIVGILTVLVTYLLARELFGKEDQRLAQWTALLAAVFLAISFWHLALNHLGFRANYLPLVEVLCFLFLWRAIRTRRVRDFVLSGFFLGLSLHTYASARFVPIVLVVFFAVLLATRKGRAWVVPLWRHWILLAFVALLIFGPLLIYLVAHPEYLLPRAKGLFILSPHLHQGALGNLLVRSVVGNFGLFGFSGDPNWLYNLPGRPGLDVVQAILFWLGLVLCLVRWRRPRYLFLLVWWLVMLLPSILAPDPIPHSLRAIGTLPVACILAARILSGLLVSPPQRPRRLWNTLSLVLLVGLPFYLGWAGYNTWHSYFDVWFPRDEVYYAYHGHMADLAERINRDEDPEAVYVFPVNYDRLGETYSEYTLELLHEGPVPFRYIIVDDATVARDLTNICRQRRRVHLIAWTHGDHVDADPRQVLPFLLERFGRATDVGVYRGYRLLTYELPSETVDFGNPLDFVATPADFDNGLSLVAQAHSPTTDSGEAAWLALRWQARQAIAQDYKASLRLVDAQGHLAGQVDAWLLSNEHLQTSRWEPGRTVTTYHLLPSLPATMPGTYQLALLLYDPASQRQAQLVDSEGAFYGEVLPLGSLQIARPWRRGVIEPEVALEAVHLAPDLDLVGYDLDREAISPGETIHLALYWHALGEIAHNYVVTIRLMDEEGNAAAAWTEEPAYPTSNWRAGDLWRDWRDLKTPASLPPGEYQLTVQLAGAASLTPATLGQVQVQGRARLFEMPPIGHPLVAVVGKEFRLLGYDLAEEYARAGEVLHLTLYWQAQTESDVSYAVFTHLLDGNSRIWGQKDSVPGEGALPTTSWAAGEVIVDEYEIEIADDTPPGEYHIEVGMYRPITGQRLPIYGGAGEALGDRILLDTKVMVTP